MVHRVITTNSQKEIHYIYNMFLNYFRKTVDSKLKFYLLYYSIPHQWQLTSMSDKRILILYFF